MRNIHKYYFLQEIIDRPSCQRVLDLACQHAANDMEIERVVVFYTPLQGVDWFLARHSDVSERKLLKQYEAGKMIPECRVPVFLLPLHKATAHREGKEVVIGWGLKSKGLFVVEDVPSVKYLIAIPLNYRLITQWAYVTGAAHIQMENEEALPTYIEPHCIVRAALHEMATWMKMDEDLVAKEARHQFRTFLHHLRYAENDSIVVDSNAVMAYLVREMSWDYPHAKYFADRLESTRNRVASVYYDPEASEATLERWRNVCAASGGK
jgi:hypothetical protein